MFGIVLLTSAAITGQAADWPLETLRTTTQQVHRGLVVDDTPAGVRFRIVNRPVGRPTVTLTTFFPRAEVREVKRISDADREVLLAKLAELDPTGAGERKRMEALTLTPVDWQGRPNAARRYDSEQFILTSTASDDLTRRATVRLEQIVTAYRRFFPPRVTTQRPTTIVLTVDPADYAAAIGLKSGPILNPAVYDPATNRIVCGIDLRTLDADLSAARIHHRQQLAVIERYETDVRKLYKDARIERDRHLATAADQRAKVWAAERANDARFDAVTARLFAVLYHEAFHAYLGSAVYPSDGLGGELPRWLNEGLAQIFETAVLDAGELRVGHADRERLTKVKELNAAGGLVPVGDLVRAGRDAFVAVHVDQKVTADRTYLTSWAVAFHLMFERRLLAADALDIYRVAAATDPKLAFEAFVGMSVTDYDAELRTYLDLLRPDGTVPAVRPASPRKSP